MIKQRNKSYVIISVIQVLLIIVALVFNYFSVKKMGLMRHLVYRNYVLDGMNIKIYFWLIVAILIFALLLLQKNRKSKITSDHIFMFLLIVLITLLFNQIIPKFKYDYYYQGFLFTIIGLLQIFKLDIRLKNKKSKDFSLDFFLLYKCNFIFNKYVPNIDSYCH